LLLTALAGCGKPSEPAADPQPFKAAIATYLERNNMAMAVKEIKEGPLVEGNAATLTASLVHAQMPGPAVQWQFTFEKGQDGQWRTVRHKAL
jgi:hypothetical protein